MYSVLLHENSYFTGSYAEIGSISGGVDIPSLPPDMEKATCYRLADGCWVFDEEKWEQLNAEQAIAVIREQREIAFRLIDKYQLTLIYESLTAEQRIELIEYRKAWLDAPETGEAPERPEWMI